MKAQSSKAIQTRQKKWAPEYYNAHCVLQYRTSLSMIKTLSLNGNENILDVGSGTGNVTAELARLVPRGHVTGLDASQSMVNFASQNHRIDNMTYRQQDILDLSDKERFDVIVSFWTLSWVNNQSLALSNIVRSLKPGGTLLLMYPLRHDAYEVADKLIKSEKWKTTFKDFNSPRPFVSRDYYESIIASIPSVDFTVKSKALPCVFNSREEMQSSIKSWMSYLDYIESDALKTRFLDDFTDAYLSFSNLANDHFEMYFNVLEISGHKLQASHHNTPELQVILRSK